MTASSARDDAVDADAFLTGAFTDYVESGHAVWRYLIRHPVVALRTLRALRRLMPLDVRLPDVPEAAAIQDALLAHPFSRRAMSGVAAVLATPARPGGYADGPDRATARRKVRAALKLGVTVRPVPPAERHGLIALADRHERENEREAYRVEQPANDDLLSFDLWLAAHDADGAPIALAVIPAAGEWAVLRYFRTLVPGRASSDARYLMTQEVAEELARRGVRHLVDSARPHWLPNGLRHFQRMVGFRLVRLRSIRVEG